MNPQPTLYMKKLILRARPSHAPLLLAAALTIFLASAPAVRASLIIDLPDLTLQPNQAGQTFTISVQNDGPSVTLNGVELELLIGDGSGVGPIFQAVSVIAPGTLFASNNTGDRGAGDLSNNQVFQRTTSTSSGTVTLDNGTFDLATVTFDTTGVSPGDYSWSPSDSPNGPSFFTDSSGTVTPTLANGTLSVSAVPEPVNGALAVFGTLMAVIGGSRWLRRRRHKQV